MNITLTAAEIDLLKVIMQCTKDEIVVTDCLRTEEEFMTLAILQDKMRALEVSNED